MATSGHGGGSGEGAKCSASARSDVLLLVGIEDGVARIVFEPVSASRWRADGVAAQLELRPPKTSSATILAIARAGTVGGAPCAAESGFEHGPPLSHEG